MKSSPIARAAVQVLCLAALMIAWGSSPPLRATTPGITNLKSIVIRKGILVNGNPTDVEIKQVVPALRVGMDVPPSQGPESASVPELYAFERLEHPQGLTVETAKLLVCRAGQSKITKAYLQQMIKYVIEDEQLVPERHRIWARYLVFITQGNLKAMFVVYNFEEKPPVGPMAASSYVMEDGAWKAWATDVQKILELSNAFNVCDANNLSRFFREEK